MDKTVKTPLSYGSLHKIIMNLTDNLNINKFEECLFVIDNVTISFIRRRFITTMQ